MIFGKHTSNAPASCAPTPPDTGPARYAVLVHNGRRVKIDRVLECIEYAKLHSLVGATVTCLGSSEWCAKIERFDWRQILDLETRCVGLPRIGLEEAQILLSA